MTQIANFVDRSAELDAIVDQCRANGDLPSGIIRDTSNRSSRDMPWWSIEIERTHHDGTQNRRATASVTLSPTPTGDVHSFEARWRAQIWTGSNTDSFNQWGGWDLTWECPSTDLLKETMENLLQEAQAAIDANG